MPGGTPGSGQGGSSASLVGSAYGFTIAPMFTRTHVRKSLIGGARPLSTSSSAMRYAMAPVSTALPPRSAVHPPLLCFVSRLRLFSRALCAPDDRLRSA